jgi:hypothetical protein
MPLNVAQGLYQPALSWGMRGFFFVAFGVVVGTVFRVLEDEANIIRRLAYRDPKQSFRTRLHCNRTFAVRSIPGGKRASRCFL